MARLNLSNGVSSALGGAASGAAVGSVVPGIGTAAGAIGGGLAGLAGGLFSGSGGKTSTLDRTQRSLYKQYAQGVQGQGPMADLFNYDQQGATDNFNRNYAQPAYQKFQQEIAPTITGSFRSSNLGNSSYAANALGRAGADVQKNLDNNLQNILYQGQQNSLERRIQALRDILSNQTFAKNQRQPSAIDSILGGLSSGAGQALGSKFADSYMAPKPQSEGTPFDPNIPSNSAQMSTLLGGYK